jgi:hypothetical protein
MIYGPSAHEKRGVPIREGIEQHYMKRFSQHVAGKRYLLVEIDVLENLIFACETVVPEHGSNQKPDSNSLWNCLLVGRSRAGQLKCCPLT